MKSQPSKSLKLYLNGTCSLPRCYKDRRAAGETTLAMIGIEESVEGTRTEQITLVIRARTSKIIVLMLVMDQSTKNHLNGRGHESRCW